MFQSSLPNQILKTSTMFTCKHAGGGQFARVPPDHPPLIPFPLNLNWGEPFLHGFHINVNVLLIFYDPSVFLYSVLFNLWKKYDSYVSTLTLLVTGEHMNEINLTATVSSDSSVNIYAVCVGLVRNVQWLVYFLLAIQLLESQRSQLLLFQGSSPTWPSVQVHQRGQHTC